MPKGLIIKALSGYYYVLPETGAHLDECNLIECRARGIFKHKRNPITPLVGDEVVYSQSDTGEGTVEEIMPRRTELIRPPIANANTAILVFSVDEPALNLQLLDKFLVHVEFAGLDSILCLTKHDLLAEDAGNEESFVPKVIRLYESLGYPVVSTSAKHQQGIDWLKDRLAGTISVFSGQSGVGKSSLLNAIKPELQLETNHISMKLGRGKHTTRHVELIQLDHGGWVADTPGFSSLDFAEIEAEDLSGCFREFRKLSEDCRFRGCFHDKEPGCRVREAVEQGEASETRYTNYLTFLHEIKDRKRRY